MTRRFLVLAAVLLAVTAAAAWALAGRDSRRATPAGQYRPDAAAARSAARDACQAFERFVAEVGRNGSADRARSLLDRFEESAARAYERDVVWVRLLSATKALKAGFGDDDPEVTRAGLDLARAQCAPLTG